MLLGEVLARLEERADPVARDQMASRYGIHAADALGVPMRDLKALAAEVGRSHALAASLWASGGYEARTVAAFVDEPELVTVEQMDGWAADFDNWAICDTVCFHLFDRCAPAWGRVEVWAVDERPLVGKAVIMAMKAIGKKHPSMVPAVRASASRLASSSSVAAARVGRAVAKELPG